MRGGAGAVLLLVVVAAVLAAGWLFRDRLVTLVSGGGDPVEVSPEAADRAEEKLVTLRDEQREVRLSGVEISSLLRYRTPGWAAERLSDPSVRMSGDTVVLSGTVATEHLPSHPELDRVRGILPDSAPVEVVGHLRTLDGGRTAFEVRSVEFASLPIPQRYYDDILARLGRRDEPGLAPNAVALRLPDEVRAARVESGYLILTP